MRRTERARRAARRYRKSVYTRFLPLGIVLSISRWYKDRQFRQIVVLGVAVIVIDWGSKWLFRLLELPIMENPYGPFGLFSISIVIPASIVALCGLCILFRGNVSKAERVGMTLVIGGGVANVGERLFRGSVSDIFFIGHAAWNIADMTIIVGALFVFISLIHTAVRHEH